ncbi:hypothetical protein GQ55_6G241300 [Panicum hallii var. hallii]|uniref:Uncharacterized protein n=1 Tax=Panicum hallii var. hallii TaxID=1504633 RepID=A0A2T7D943_9POAL|nr:hypothetical protein GQ55_6G241300 [Panicum hallii var. hallii]
MKLDLLFQNQFPIMKCSYQVRQPCLHDEHTLDHSFLGFHSCKAAAIDHWYHSSSPLEHLLGHGMVGFLHPRHHPFPHALGLVEIDHQLPPFDNHQRMNFGWGGAPLIWRSLSAS